ncbi:zinc-containing alcohol dehydrogenase [Sandaracinus amylolyticus]|uniref:Zinc-containing alcohol dehydrogenase n=1 Tax=Sandaracinus amylolyticus TaxID=927083 RepID=A0A0F6W861_9BACT|nr:zinc-containing alcohol dehydrogenase [Sandaracinus amylolyticus]
MHRFGGIEEMALEEVPVPTPGEGEVLVRVAAAGVGPWDAYVRSGTSVLGQKVPLTPGSDISGVVERVGPDVKDLAPGDEVYGATNGLFTGGYAEHAIARASMLAPKPTRMSHVEAAAVPVVGVTAWEMVFEHARVAPGQRVLVHGGAGSLGAIIVQLASRAGAHVVATAHARDLDEVLRLGAREVIDPKTTRFEDRARDVDVVLDTVGGETLARSLEIVKQGGIVVSAASQPDAARAAARGVRALYFIVKVSRETLSRLAERIDRGELVVRVGEVLPLAEARAAHEMLAGKPHRRGKIVLTTEAAAPA